MVEITPTTPQLPSSALFKVFTMLQGINFGRDPGNEITRLRLVSRRFCSEVDTYKQHRSEAAGGSTQRLSLLVDCFTASESDGQQTNALFQSLKAALLNQHLSKKVSDLRPNKSRRSGSTPKSTRRSRGISSNC